VIRKNTSSVKVADLNGDGYTDIVEGNYEQANYVYLGNENGGFREICLAEDLNADTYDIILGDLNGDGWIDIIEANSGEMNLIYVTREK